MLIGERRVFERASIEIAQRAANKRITVVPQAQNRLILIHR